MQVAFFSSTKTDKKLFKQALSEKYSSHSSIQITFFEAHLAEATAILAKGFDAVCVFVNDDLNAPVLQSLHDHGVKLVTLRCAGFNNIDREKAKALGMPILRVPAYSPMAVAEHALALIMTLNRKTHKAYNRVREGNFALEGLLGFDLFGKTIGIIGTGRIGCELIRILSGFGMTILAHDPYPNGAAVELGARYVELDELYRQSDIISLHSPLLPETTHLINQTSINKMKPGVMLINTSRGALMQAEDLVHALKNHQIGYLGLDVYEQEEDLFFEDHSEEIIQDDVFERLLTFPNVLVTAHQAFYTQEALQNIVDTTFENLIGFSQNQINPNNCVLCET